VIGITAVMMQISHQDSFDIVRDVHSAKKELLKGSRNANTRLKLSLISFCRNNISDKLFETNIYMLSFVVASTLFSLSFDPFLSILGLSGYSSDSSVWVELKCQKQSRLGQSYCIT